MKIIYPLLSLLLITSKITLAQVANGDYRTKTFNAVWSTPSHWQVRTNGTWATATVAPGANDNVFIQAGHLVTLTANAACKDLHLNSAPMEPRLDMQTYTLSVSGKIRAYTGNATVNTTDGNLPGVGSTPSTNSNWIASTTGKLLVTGGTRILFNTGEWGSSNVGALPSTGNGYDLEISLNNDTNVVTSQTEIKARNVAITTGTLDMGTSRLSVDQGSPGTGTVTVNGTLKSANSGPASTTLVLSRDVSSRISTLTIGSTGVLSLSGTDPRIDASTIVNNGKVIYTGAAQTFVRKSGSDASATNLTVYNNVTLAGTGAKTLIANTTVNGTLSQRESATLSLGTFALSYGTSPSIEYAGNVPQTTGSELPASITNLVINNASGITLNGSHTISGNLNLINGILTTTSTNLLSLSDNATTTNASDSSHVSGPVSKIGDDAFIFPVGKSGKYHPVGISAPSNTTDIFTAEYFDNSHVQAGAIALGSSALTNVSQREYWDVSRTAGSSLPNITLTWQSQNSVGTGTLSNLRVAHYNGSTWDNLGNISTTGTASNGSITASTTSLISFSPFTLATVSSIQPLPLTLLSFNAQKVSSNVLLEWVTTCESNMERYNVEYSTGSDFKTIGVLTAKNQGCGNEGVYHFSYSPVGQSIGFYRLKMVDMASNSSFSKILSIRNDDSGTNKLRISGNPTNEKIEILGMSAGDTYYITDIAGNVVRTGIALGSIEDINISKLSSGLYMFRSGVSTLKILKQ